MVIVLCALLLALALLTLSPALADQRWIPQRCHELVGELPNKSWNEPYNRGFRAIQREDFQEAEQEMCRALQPAREFDARDCRSGIHSYTTRLGWINDEIEDRAMIDKLREEPWRIGGRSR